MSPRDLRKLFLQNLRTINGPRVTVSNTIDDTSPPVDFNFINENIYGDGVVPVDKAFMSGCNCRVENGRNCGCEFRYCGCLQLSARDGAGEVHFPYSAGRSDYGCLRNYYLQSRHHIYECNSNCNCLDNCKNKVVQHGRRIPLEIFKTETRGWGKSFLSSSFASFHHMLTIARITLSSGSSQRPICRYVSRRNYHRRGSRETGKAPHHQRQQLFAKS